MYACMHACMYVCMYVCMNVVCVCACVCGRTSSAGVTVRTIQQRVYALQPEERVVAKDGRCYAPVCCVCVCVCVCVTVLLVWFAGNVLA
jgi:hypothetical protein